MEIHFQLEPSWFGATLQDSKTNQDLPRYQPSCISRNSLNSLSGKRMFSCDALHQLRPPGCVLSEASQVTACDAFGYSSYAHEWIESRTDAICPSQRWMIHHAEMVKVGPSSKAPCTARCGHPCCWLWQRPLMLHIPAPVGCSWYPESSLCFFLTPGFHCRQAMHQEMPDVLRRWTGFNQGGGFDIWSLLLEELFP